jgi:catechol 2,3-dioxygenase-like lactoylglutathione lyase family enzyme
MGLTGIESVTYGVADMSKATRFYVDFGLRKVRSGKSGTVLETQDGAQVVLRPRAAPELPPAIERGSTLREMTWGVQRPGDLETVARELTRDREVRRDPDGTLHSVDDMGLGIAFRVTRRRKIKSSVVPMNTPGAPARIDERATYYERAQPLHIGHCVFGAPDIKKQELFYTRRLGFHVSDYYTGRGIFLRCAARGGHHNLFFLETADGKPRLNHVAFAVRDIHELFAGGSYFNKHGWKTAIGPGRHHVSSCYFWYFESPAGGTAEYFCDEDFCTESWRPKQWNPAPETFAEWVLAEGLPRANILPPTREARDS